MERGTATSLFCFKTWAPPTLGWRDSVNPFICQELACDKIPCDASAKISKSSNLLSRFHHAVITSFRYFRWNRMKYTRIKLNLICSRPSSSNVNIYETFTGKHIFAVFAVFAFSPFSRFRVVWPYSRFRAAAVASRFHGVQSRFRVFPFSCFCVFAPYSRTSPWPRHIFRLHSCWSPGLRNWSFPFLYHMCVTILYIFGDDMWFLRMLVHMYIVYMAIHGYSQCFAIFQQHHIFGDWKSTSVLYWHVLALRQVSRQWS